jgi:tripartite ATP-independent transporter DctM subunit
MGIDNWWLALLLTFGSLVVLMITGLPVAFAFLALDIIWVLILWGGTAGLNLFILDVRESLTSFLLLPIILFMLMGEVIYRAGIAPQMMDALDKWIGRLPGRLSLLAVAGGTLLATLTGTGMASCAMLGSTLYPEMKRRGYSNAMSLGPIMGSAGLAVMIPPIGLAVLFGVFAKVSIGKLLIGIITPGILLAILMAIYILVQARSRPDLAPSYDAPSVPLKDKITATAKYILPVALVIFLVTGVIFLGIATPTEAAATGAFGCFILVILYGGLKWKVIKSTLAHTTEICVMMLAILFGADIFSQITSFTGAIKGFTDFIINLQVPPIGIIILIQLIGIFLGLYMGGGAIIMITSPVFMPIVVSLGFDPVWFGVIYILNMEMAAITPPYGLTLFVMKSVAGPDVSMGEVFRAAMPYCYLQVGLMALMITFPQIVLWLPGFMSNS